MIAPGRVNHRPLCHDSPQHTHTYTILQSFVSMSDFSCMTVNPLKAGATSPSLCPQHHIWQIKVLNNCCDFFFLQPYLSKKKEVHNKWKFPGHRINQSCSWGLHHGHGSICDLHHSLQQCRILHPPNKARDWTSILRDSIGTLSCWVTTGTPVTGD